MAASWYGKKALSSIVFPRWMRQVVWGNKPSVGERSLKVSLWCLFKLFCWYSFCPQRTVIALYMNNNTCHTSTIKLEVRPDLGSLPIALHMDTLKCHPSRVRWTIRLLKQKSQLKSCYSTWISFIWSDPDWPGISKYYCLHWIDRF